jgi:hypothetical protein
MANQYINSYIDVVNDLKNNGFKTDKVENKLLEYDRLTSDYNAGTGPFNIPYMTKEQKTSLYNKKSNEIYSVARDFFLKVSKEEATSDNTYYDVKENEDKIKILENKIKNYDDKENELANMTSESAKNNMYYEDKEKEFGVLNDERKKLEEKNKVLREKKKKSREKSKVSFEVALANITALLKKQKESEEMKDMDVTGGSSESTAVVTAFKNILAFLIILIIVGISIYAVSVFIMPKPRYHHCPVHKCPI